MSKKELDNLERDVRFALRIISADRPLDWEDRTEIEMALDSALTSIELFKQEINGAVSVDNSAVDYLAA